MLLFLPVISSAKERKMGPRLQLLSQWHPGTESAAGVNIFVVILTSVGKSKKNLCMGLRSLLTNDGIFLSVCLFVCLCGISWILACSLLTDKDILVYQLTALHSPLRIKNRSPLVVVAMASQ